MGAGAWLIKMWSARQGKVSLETALIFTASLQKLDLTLLKLVFMTADQTDFNLRPDVWTICWPSDWLRAFSTRPLILVGPCTLIVEVVEVHCSGVAWPFFLHCQNGTFGESLIQLYPRGHCKDNVCQEWMIFHSKFVLSALPRFKFLLSRDHNLDIFCSNNLLPWK